MSITINDFLNIVVISATSTGNIDSISVIKGLVIHLQLF